MVQASFPRVLFEKLGMPLLSNVLANFVMLKIIGNFLGQIVGIAERDQFVFFCKQFGNFLAMISQQKTPGS